MKKLNKKQKIIIFSVIGILVVAGIITGVVLNKKPVVNNEPVRKKHENTSNIKIIDVNSDTRPIAVMINNIGEARKVQTGLEDAYMVYEIIVEGGLTRLMALYKDADTERIGSIRSSRHYFLDYALEHDAVYVHWGYSARAYNDIAAMHVNNVNGLVYGNQYFWKDNSLNVATEHRAFSSMELIEKGIKDLGYRSTTDKTPVLNYSEEEIDLSKLSTAKKADNVSITYSNSVKTSYTYDEENKVYKRFTNGSAHTDSKTNNQLTAKNIITYQVRNFNLKNGEKGQQDLDNTGNGKGYYISNGYAVEITWEKKKRSEKTIYKLKDGTELKVNDGNTYVQIQPVGEELTIS